MVLRRTVERGTEAPPRARGCPRTSGAQNISESVRCGKLSELCDGCHLIHKWGIHRRQEANLGRIADAEVLLRIRADERSLPDNARISSMKTGGTSLHPAVLLAARVEKLLWFAFVCLSFVGC